ncbi:unnamed protein product, partial [Mesorhabditis belari]|uniref:G-protein coupled receptors family 1 profile domain-containing protein n=1 Tax=Mesorhabditis belari TaxID=2138241 RepID=A0AAF3EGQ8_9BILA
MNSNGTGLELTTQSFVDAGEDAALRHMVKMGANVAWGIAMAIGIPGNLFVLFAILYFRDMHTISNVYIFNLAVADLLFLAGTPILIVQSLQQSWTFGAAVCKIYIIGNGISQFASPAFIAVLSLDRYLAVCRPVTSEWRTSKMALIASVLAWLTVILEMTPLSLFAKVITGPDQRSTCMLFWGDESIFTKLSSPSLEDENQEALLETVMEMQRQTLFSRRFFTTYTFALSYLIPLIAVWYFYANIIAKLWARRRNLWSRKESIKRTTTKVSILGLAIVVSYTLCFLPFWAHTWSIEMNMEWTKNQVLKLAVSYAAFALQYLNSAVNPFLYVFLSDAFRKNVMSMVRTGTPAVVFAKRPSKGSKEGEGAQLVPRTFVTEA